MADSQDWAQGYVTDTLYTDNTYRELSPSWLNYVAAIHGCPPRPTDREFTYIELGCGLGHSVNANAAAYPKGRFYGVDFNPAHIEHAERYARQMGIGNVQFLERSFQQLAGIDLPDFDFICLHGVYSWISAEARLAVQKLIFDKLKPGGIVYNSYNCLPGWSIDAPVRQMLYEFANLETGNSIQRASAALQRMTTLKDFKLGYFQRAADAAANVDALRQRPQNYLVHEYLNRDWNLFYSSALADEMANAKLDYLGSATLAENHLDLLLPEGPVEFIRKLPDSRSRQLAQDYLTGQRFRRDVFVRGHARLPRLQLAANLARIPFVVAGAMSALDRKVKIPRGEISFDEASFPAIKEALGLGVLTLGELVEETRKRTDKRVDLERTMTLLNAAGMVIPAAQSFRIGKQPEKPNKLKLKSTVNQLILKEMNDFLTRRGLISTAVGGSLAIDPVDALILNDLIQHGGPVEESAKRLADVAEKRGLRLQRDGKELANAAETLDHLKTLVGKFLETGVPVLTRWGIVEAA